MDFKIYDKDPVEDDFVCEASFYIGDIYSKLRDSTYIVMKYKGKESGKLYVDFSFMPAGGMGGGYAPSPSPPIMLKPYDGKGTAPGFTYDP